MRHSFQKLQLHNGLTLLGESNQANVSCSIGFFVKTGARDETPQESGVSHFLEHMMFKGTPTRDALQINRELGNLGAQANAFTSEENTVYYASVIPERFSQMQELLSDMLRPLLDPHEFATEKKVILEEIALYQDRPHFYLFENAFKDYFTGHSAGNSVLGTHDSVSALTSEQMRDYFNRRYSPLNIALVATGKFSWDSFVTSAEKLCGDWSGSCTPRDCKPFTGASSGRVFTRKKLSQAHAVLVSQGPSAQCPERYPMAILASILGDSSGSRMFWELIHTGLAESASVDSDERDGVGCFSAYLSAPPERLDRVIKLARNILDSPMDFSDADLDRAKAKIISRVVLDGELPMGRLMALGLEWNYRAESTPLSQVIEKIKAVSRRDVENALTTFAPPRWCEYRLMPE